VNLCSDDHEEVCYEGRRCPVCDMRSDKDSEIAALAKVNDIQLDDIYDLQSRIKELESKTA
jgi:hypothetical protein